MSNANRTSHTDPIEVAFLPFGLRGAVGLTFAPGKKGASVFGSPWDRDLATDLARLRDHHGASTLVCLLEDHELPMLGISGYEDAVRDAGLDLVRFPIRDVDVPSSMQDTGRLVEAIVRRAQRGERVLVHCRGGIGRTGTIGGCVLAAMRVPLEGIFESLERARGPMCPETEPQRRFIEDFASYFVRRDALLGAILGGALGDALGAPVEFMDPERIAMAYGSKGITELDRTLQTAHGRRAPFTDDTQMTEVVLRCLLESDRAGDDLEAAMGRLANGFVSWAREPVGGHRAPGNACLHGCDALSRGVRWDEAGGEGAGGCGSVMRVHPYGLVLDADGEKAIEWAVAHSKLTHRAPIALAACAGMTAAVRAATRREAPVEVASAARRAAAAYDQETAAMISAACDDARRAASASEVFERLRGWAAHECLAGGIFAFLSHPDDPVQAMILAANTPGDSDSLASVAGVLAGARGGLLALPEDWVTSLERWEDLYALAEEAASPGTALAADTTGGAMRTFDEIVNQLRWSGASLDDVVVGTFDRVRETIVEVPLGEFLVSEIPHHRARYLRRGSEYLWDRRPALPQS